MNIEAHLDSRDRQMGTSDNFRVNLNRPIPAVTELSLESVELPNSIYAIDGSNNAIDFEEQTSSLILFAAIPVGNYSGTTLATTLASILTAESASAGNSLTYTVTYSTTTNKFTISAGGNFKFLWVSGLHEANAANVALGYPEADTSYTMSSVSVNQIDISGPRYLYLFVSGVDSSNSVSSNSGGQSTFAKLQLVNSPGAIEFYTSATGFNNFKIAQQQQIAYFNVSLQSYYGAVDLNGIEWSLTLGMKSKEYEGKRTVLYQSEKRCCGGGPDCSCLVKN